MIAFKESATRLLVTGPPEVIRQLIVSFRYHPANYWMSDKYKQQVWDGYFYPMRRRAWTATSVTAEIPRGYRDDVLARLKDAGEELDTRGLLFSPFSGISAEDVPEDIVQSGFKLDDLQRQAVAAWLEHVIGINYATVGAGKTVMFAAAAAMIKQRYPNARFLYFTQTERLVRQVHEELLKFLPSWHITRFGGGSRDETGKDLVVATGAMLNRHFKRLKAAGWFRSYQGVLCDECHHLPAKSFRQAMEIMPAFFRLGASDTLCEDDPERWNIIRGLLGPVRHRIEARHLIKDVALSLTSSGRLAKPHIFLVDVPAWTGRFKTEHTPEPDTEAFALVDGQWKKGLYLGPVYDSDPDTADGVKRDKQGEPVKLINFHRLALDGMEYDIESRWCLLERTRDHAVIKFVERNRLIAQWAKYYSDKGWPTLVVCTPTLHILILQALIGKAVGADKVRILYSEHSSSERDEAFQWLKTTPGAVLISSLVKEGVNLPEIRGGVIADHIVSWEVARQAIGRFIRKKHENFAEITLFIDRQHPKLLKGSIQMLEKLSKTRGFCFYHPVVTPDTIPQALRYDEVAVK